MLLPEDIQYIQARLQGELPGEKAHLEMLPFREATSKMLESVREYRESSVAILLFHEQNILKSVLIQRPKYDGSHSGQISFPGGKREDSDHDLMHTAIREMHEEIGFFDEDIAFLGALTRVYIPVSGFLVFPHVFYTQNVSEFTPDPREVQKILTFQVEHICKPENQTATKIKLDNGVSLRDVPCFIIEEKIVWGATALMMNELKRVLY